ncbi:MAG: hypothetical protein ACTS73_08220 [Arsenophonus sp. NEOnobi-MAG3]
MKNIVELFCDANCSFIIRTEAKGLDDNKLTQDTVFLKRLDS